MRCQYAILGGIRRMKKELPDIIIFILFAPLMIFCSLVCHFLYDWWAKKGNLS